MSFPKKKISDPVILSMIDSMLKLEVTILETIELQSMNRTFSQEENTQYILSELPYPDFSEGFCWLRNRDGKIGRITLEDACENLWIIRSERSQKVIGIYPQLEHLIDSGWICD
jgi:hypothetical protein